MSDLCFTLRGLTNNFQPLIDQLRAGDPRALARAISTVENRAPGWSELLKALFPHSGNARILGLTGPPGAGKSTLVISWPATIARKNRTVGIIAVDPTSPYTGGAILGDRIRMQEHFSDPGIYIRSMATRGSLGGLARTTADVATVLDASGRDLVMIETVGVGQDEVDIVRLADITIVILVPGMGDDVQTIKAGIMEIADIFVINKCDRDGAERVEREIRALQSLAVRSDQLDPTDCEDRGQRGRRHCGTGGGDSRVRSLSAEGKSGGNSVRLRTGRIACWRCCVMPCWSGPGSNWEMEHLPVTPQKSRSINAILIRWSKKL